MSLQKSEYSPIFYKIMSLKVLSDNDEPSFNKPMSLDLEDINSKPLNYFNISFLFKSQFVKLIIVILVKH